MLVEFRVRNFRSLRDEQTLSLVASKDKTLPNNTMCSGIKAAPLLLRSAVIYGANASGKSNFIKALQYMQEIVASSATVMQPGQAFNVQPFRLDRESNTQATAFEVTFILDSVRYQYGFEFTTQRIIREYLLVYKTPKPQQWFNRRFDPETGKDHYHFGPGFSGSKNLWEGATRPNSLFLSMAVQLNSIQLRPVFDWFCEKLIIFSDTFQFNTLFSVDMLRQSESKKEICDFLTAADISIADINVIPQKKKTQEVRIDAATGKTEIHDRELEFPELQFLHVTDKGDAVFGIEDESLGTRRLLFMSGPLIDILKKGLTLIVDELDTSLHPLLVKRLAEFFHSPASNPKGAQLVFITHDTSLLDYKLFRRDQIWLVEKDREQASKLYPLTDFSPRKGEALERGYLIGRYGALPFFSDWHAR